MTLPSGVSTMPLVTRQTQTIYYNGYANFGPYTKTERLSCKPEHDISGRTTVGNRYSLTLTTYVTGVNAKAESEKMRKALSKNGGRLVITGLSSGDIRVNDGQKWDIRWGPWVDDISIDPTVGGERAAKFTWTISWVIPECDDAAYRYRVSEFAYSVAYSQDEAGYNTRVIDLRLRVPQNHLAPNNRRLADNPEDYAISVLPPEIPGFRRTYGTRTFSEARDELKWTITDTQLDGQPPYPGVVRESGSVSYSSDSTMGVQWNGSIQYDCELPANGVLETAIDAMSSFVNDRLARVRRLRQRDGRPAAVVPVSFQLNEPECFGRRKFAFSVSFTVTTSLQQLLTRSGMWSPAPGRDWRVWSLSLQDTALNPRGYYALEFDAGQDRVTDLCGRESPKVFTQGVRPRRQNRGVLSGLVLPETDRNNSWRTYSNRIWVETESGVVATRTLPTQALTSDVDRDGSLVANGTSDFLGGSGGPFGGGVGNGGGLPPGLIPPGGGRLENEFTPNGKNTATRIARPRQWVMMEGSATRIGFEIPEPTLRKVNGVDLIPASRPDMGEGFKQEAFYSNGVQTFYRAKWRLRFAVDGDLPDRPLPAAPNPLVQ